MLSSNRRLCIVTGSNKGIGYEIAKSLLHSGCNVILACRNPLLGSQAAFSIERNGGECEYMHLDVASPSSIDSFVDEVTKRFNHVDVLVNNAGIAFKRDDLTPFKEQMKPTLDTNFYGTITLTEKLTPLLLKSLTMPRVVNVASSAGHLSKLKGSYPAMAERFSSPTLTTKELLSLMKEYEDDVMDGTSEAKGWPAHHYGMSKLGLIAYTKVMAREYEGRINVSACCPGYCNTVSGSCYKRILVVTTTSLVTKKSNDQEQRVSLRGSASFFSMHQIVPHFELNSAHKYAPIIFS